MQLKTHQLNTINNLFKHDKSFVFWPRQTGKSYIISHYLECFVTNNFRQNILFINRDKGYVDIDRDRIMRNIGSLTIDKHRTENLYFINDNYLEFCCIKQNIYPLTKLNPSLIICDEFYFDNVSQLLPIKRYIDKSKCKCIFTSTYIDMNVIKMLDDKNDFYINIIEPNENDLDIGHDYKEKIKELSYKPENLLDYNNVVYQRKKKLKKLNIISNESEV